MKRTDTVTTRRERRLPNLEEIVHAELTKAPGSARELSARCQLTEDQVRSAIDRLRTRHGKDAILNRKGSFSLG